MNMGIWIVDASNQFFIRGSHIETSFQKYGVVTPFFAIGRFCTPHSICLNIGFCQGSFVLKFFLCNHSHCVESVQILRISPYSVRMRENTDQKILRIRTLFTQWVLSTEIRYSSFLKKILVFRKICFKVKVLETFKIYSGCHIKTCQSLKRSAISKISSTLFQKNLGFKMKPLSQSACFPVLRQKPTQILP